MLIDPQDLLKPEKQHIHLHKLLRLKPAQRTEELLAIAPLNVLLAAKCLHGMRRQSSEPLRPAVLAEARRQAQIFTDTKQAQRGILALHELKSYNELIDVFKKIEIADKFYRYLFEGVFTQSSSDFIFKIIDIMFFYNIKILLFSSFKIQ